MSLQQEELLIGGGPTSDLEVHHRIGCELVADPLRAGGEARVRVMVTRMLPALWPGDILVIRRGATAPSVGEIALFLRYGRLFAHRVLRTTGAQLITRGDALPDSDPPVRASEVLGVVVGIIRDGSGLVPAPPPSYWQRIVAFAIRHSEVIYRLVLRMRGLFTRSFIIAGRRRWHGQ